jgi:hypothetical protein
MSENEKKSPATNSLEFYVGIVLMAAGLFFLLNKTVVYSGFYNWRIGGFNISSGLVIIPLLVGIIWLFYNPKSWIAKLITVLGGIFIIASIIMSLNIHFTTTTMFDYIIMIVLIASGAGLLLRSFFKKD